MNSYLAFFDLDETIINCKSLFEAYKAYCLSDSIALKGEEKFNAMMQNLKCFQEKNISRDELNRIFYGYFSGFSRSKMINIVKEWFAVNCKKTDFFNHAVLKELREHQANGARIIIVSGSFYDCVFPIADYLKASDFLCINLEYVNDIYTGKIIGIQTIGEGKLTAISHYVQKFNLEMKGSYGYGDHISDLSFLNVVENPVTVGSDDALMTISKAKNWRSINS